MWCITSKLRKSGVRLPINAAETHTIEPTLVLDEYGLSPCPRLSPSARPRVLKLPEPNPRRPSPNPGRAKSNPRRPSPNPGRARSVQPSPKLSRAYDLQPHSLKWVPAARLWPSPLEGGASSCVMAHLASAPCTGPCGTKKTLPLGACLLAHLCPTTTPQSVWLRSRKLG